MYSYRLRIRCMGMPRSFCRHIDMAIPREGFTHELAFTPGFAEQFAKDADIIIMSDEMDAPASYVHGYAQEKAKLVICSKEPEVLDDASLAVAYDVWPYLEDGQLVDFYINRLLDTVKAEKDAWLDRTWLDSTIDTMPDLIWYKDVKGAHLKVNDAFCNTVGKTKEDIKGRGHYYIWGLTKEEYEKGEFVCLESEEETMQAGHTCLFDEQVIGRQGLRRMKTYKTPLYNEDGTIMGAVGIARDVTKEYEYQQKILEAARYDELTKLANRRYFYEYVSENRGDAVTTLLYMDLDHFKSVNDTYGHQAGDEALVMTSKTIKESFPNAFAARLGGDEFVVAAFGEMTRDKIENYVKEFFRALHEKCIRDERFKNLSCSVGITIAEAGVPLDDIVHQGDVALYKVKNTERGGFHFFDGKE